MARLLCRLIVACVMAVAIVPAHAVAPDEILEDRALEERARALSANLRCMVCQNQSIDDSDAPLARDLRVLVRERLVAGDSDNQVIDFLVSRYGEFVLLKPRLTWNTILLWGVAPVMLIIGVSVLLMGARRRRNALATGSGPGLNSDEQAALDRILKNGDGSNT